MNVIESIKDSSIKFMQKLRKNRNLNMEKNHREDIDLMKKLLSFQTKSKKEDALVEYLVDYVAKNYPQAEIELDKENNILITKGSANPSAGRYFPCLVAHTDEVHEEREAYTIEESEDKNDGNLLLYGTNKIKEHSYTSWYKGKQTDFKKEEEIKQCGIGADDKAGIFVALKMLEELDNIKVFFPTQEEIGTLGSKAVDLKWFEDVGYILEGDKHGQFLVVNKYSGDDIFSDSFKDILKGVMDEFTWEYTNGLSTDVMTLSKRGVNRSVINFSVGYYNHHTAKEILDMNELLESVDFIKELIDSLGDDLYEFDYNKNTKKSYSNYGGNNNYGNRGIGYGSNWRDEWDNYYGENSPYYKSKETKEDKVEEEVKNVCGCNIEGDEFTTIDAECELHNSIKINGDFIECQTCGSLMSER